MRLAGSSDGLLNLFNILLLLLRVFLGLCSILKKICALRVKLLDFSIDTINVDLCKFYLLLNVCSLELDIGQFLGCFIFKLRLLL